MSSTSLEVKTSMVCEIVGDPTDVPNMANLFHLAATLTGQETEVCITNDPSIAGVAVFAESSAAYPGAVISAMDLIRRSFRSRTERGELFDRGMADLAAATANDPYSDAGRALIYTMQGATAIFVNVDDSDAFRRELEVFKDLAQPRAQAT